MIKLMHKRMHKGPLLMGLIVFVLISLSIVSLAEPARQMDNIPAGDSSVDNRTAIFFIIPTDEHRDAGNASAFASLKEIEQDIIDKMPDDTNSTHAEILFRHWQGFALKGNESKSLRVSIEIVRPVDAMSIRRLLASNMTVEEIRKEIRKEEGDAILRGIMRLSDTVYMLSDIKMTPSANNTILDANIYQMPSRSNHNNTSAIGHLNVVLSEKDISEVSQGVLSINLGKGIENYKVLLDAQPPDHDMMGAGHMMSRMM